MVESFLKVLLKLEQRGSIPFTEAGSLTPVAYLTKKREKMETKVYIVTYLPSPTQAAQRETVEKIDIQVRATSHVVAMRIAESLAPLGMVFDEWVEI